MRRKSEKEILHQQLELLEEKSKDVCLASNELSQNSMVMAKKKMYVFVITISVFIGVINKNVLLTLLLSIFYIWQIKKD